MEIDLEKHYPLDAADSFVPMDPESNWDICPVCRADMETLEWISVGMMRSRHEAHKRAGQEGGDSE